MRRVRGFTLIELMIVVAIMAILAGLAMSAYSNSMRKSRRAEAKQGIADFVVRQTKWRAGHPTYIGTNSSSANITEFGGSVGVADDTGSYYKVEVTSLQGSQAYTIRATPKGDQAKDSCGTLSYALSAGTTVTKLPAECWK